jgi:CheY-like chemotaxis protein
MKKKVLVVDDSQIVLEKAVEALSVSNYEVYTALSAQDADRFIYGNRPDLILMDVMMPGIDGDKKAKMLKDDALTRDIPLLLLSSKPASELERLVAESGSDGFIRKPFTFKEMVGTVSSFIALH